ncbi:MAG: acyl-CoA thioesterase/bile acid-CoA:amino acid N-acyltransferase family protein, partial [Armatimonadota bacterium]
NVPVQTNLRAPSPRIEIQPACALIDEPVAIRLTGFAIGQHVTLRARMTNHLGFAWESHATFVADTRGCVDACTQPPVGGTYEQVDPMGLFWSMAPPAELPASPFSVVPPLRVQLDAAVDGTIVASAEAERSFIASGVTRTEVRDNGMVAALFRPAASGLRPAIVVVGGSGGGLWEAPAALLASRGFVTLALAYFGIEPLPPGLVEIPLEYFGTAIRWLQQQDGVHPHSLAVLGQSRGGELALLLGATFPEIRAVVAYVPSGVMWGAVQAGTERLPSVPAWTHHGQPLPFMEKAIADISTIDEMLSMKGAIDWTHSPIVLTPGFVAALQKEEAVAQATIPVEHTRGPILMISGQDDQMWPSTRLAEIAVQRLTQHNFVFPVEHLSYPQAGHLVSLPYLPTTLRHSRHPITKLDFAYGGTAAGDSFARADSWPRVVAFLRTHLGG